MKALPGTEHPRADGDSEGVPTPPSQAGNAEGHSRRLLGLLENLGVRYGLEHSYKFLGNTLLPHRYLAGFRLHRGKADLFGSILELCGQIDMPESFIEAFRAEMGKANIALFGFEENRGACLYKAYLEYGGNFRRLSMGTPEPFRIHTGFKWDARDNRVASVATYTCHPLISLDEMMGRIEVFYGPSHRPLFAVCRKIVERAVARLAHREFLYAEVQEEGNPRYSFDVNLYRANLRLHELHDLLMETCEYFAVPAQEFSASYDGARNNFFGHLSGGLDRAGRDFLTVYFGPYGSSR